MIERLTGWCLRILTLRWILACSIFYHRQHPIGRWYQQRVSSGHDHLYDRSHREDHTEGKEEEHYVSKHKNRIIWHFTMAEISFVNSFWSICPSSEMSYLFIRIRNREYWRDGKPYISNATERRSSISPWLVAEIAKRNSSKSMLPSLFESKVSNANLNNSCIVCLSAVHTLTCRSCLLCPEDRIVCRPPRTSSCPSDHWDNHGGNPRNSLDSIKREVNHCATNRMPFSDFYKNKWPWIITGEKLSLFAYLVPYIWCLPSAWQFLKIVSTTIDLSFSVRSVEEYERLAVSSVDPDFFAPLLPMFAVLDQ